MADENLSILRPAFNADVQDISATRRALHRIRIILESVLNASGSGRSSNKLADLGDVELSLPAGHDRLNSGELLVWDRGSGPDNRRWINKTLTEADVASKTVLDSHLADTANPHVTDHGALGGLSDDDHTQYMRHDGTRTMTGALAMGAHAISNATNIGCQNLTCNPGSVIAVTSVITPSVNSGSSTLTLQTSNGDVVLSPAGASKNVILDGVDWPDSAGSSGQFLKTNGSDAASWASLAVSDISDAKSTFVDGKILHYLDPKSTDGCFIHYSPKAATLNAVRFGVKGSGAESVTFNIEKRTAAAAQNPFSSGTDLFTADLVATVSTWDDSPSVPDTTSLSAGDVLWYSASAMSGDPTDLVIGLELQWA